MTADDMELERLRQSKEDNERNKRSGLGKDVTLDDLFRKYNIWINDVDNFMYKILIKIRSQRFCLVRGTQLGRLNLYPDIWASLVLLPLISFLYARLPVLEVEIWTLVSC